MRLVVIERVWFTRVQFSANKGRSRRSGKEIYAYEDDGELAFGYGRKILADRCIEADARYKAARV